MTALVTVTQADREALCDILSVPRDWASPERDGHPELARALPIIARHRIAAETASAARVAALVEALGYIQQIVEDSAYCVRVDTPVTPFTKALNKIHEVAAAALSHTTPDEGIV